MKRGRKINLAVEFPSAVLIEVLESEETSPDESEEEEESE